MPLSVTALLLAQAAALPAPPPSGIAHMVALYNDICLKAFPDDAAVDALMAENGAAPMRDADVKVTLREDPGRGWSIPDKDGAITVILELPPFHACSVRGGPAGAITDLAGYDAIAASYKAAHPGFVAQPPMKAQNGGIRIEADSEFRATAGDAGGEMLMVIRQQIVDPARIAKGETSTPLRFVHQIKER